MKTTIVKTILCVIAVGLISIQSNAQALSGSKKSEARPAPVKQYTPDFTVVKAGDNLINVTLGVIDFRYMPPFVAASYERGIYQINDNLCLGVGATVGLTGVDKVYGLGLYALGNIHFTAVKNLDLYAGLDLGGTIPLDKHGVGTLFKKLVYPGHIGASYYFTKGFGATVRIGGWGAVNVGLAAKF